VDLAARPEQPPSATGTPPGPAAPGWAERPKPPAGGRTRTEGVVDFTPDPSPGLRPDPATLAEPPRPRSGSLPRGHDVDGAFGHGGGRPVPRGGEAPHLSIGTIEVVVTRPATSAVAAPRPDPPSDPHRTGAVPTGPSDRGRDGRRRWYGTAQS
jgi:hypothetical protein